MSIVSITIISIEQLFSNTVFYRTISGDTPIGYFISSSFLTIKGNEDIVPLRAPFYDLSMSL